MELVVAYTRGSQESLLTIMHKLLQHRGSVLGVRQAHLRDGAQNMRGLDVSLSGAQKMFAGVSRYVEGVVAILSMEDGDWMATRWRK